MAITQTSLSGLALLCLFLACSCDDGDPEKHESDSTTFQVIHVSLHESDPVNFFLPADIDLEGILTLLDSTGSALDYHIRSGDNTIDVPYGTYRGKVHGFPGFSNDSLFVQSPDDDFPGPYQAAIGRIPDFTFGISDLDIDGAWYYLIVQCDTNFGYYTFSVWGSTYDTFSSHGIDKIADYHRAIDTEGNVRLLAADLNLNDSLYNFYAISIKPLYGYLEDTLFCSWYPLQNP